VKTGILIKGSKVNVRTETLSKLRIALYKSWTAGMDAGWLSYVLEQYDFPYSHLTDAEVRAGDLRNRFDVIILSDQRTSSIINGNRKGTMPAKYVGGITQGGVENLVAFVKKGGTLICNKGSSDFAISQFKLPIKNILQDVRSDSFNCPGSLLKVNYDQDNPLAYGLPDKGMCYFSRGLVFNIEADSSDKDNGSIPAKPKIVAQYPDESLLISGWLLGDKVIRNKAAVLEVPYGRGRIILFGFSVHNRAQSYSTFKLLFNVLY